MNKRIKEIADECGLYIAYDNKAVTNKEIEFFAELIVRECMDTVANCKGTTKFDHWSAIKEHFGVEE